MPFNNHSLTLPRTSPHADSCAHNCMWNLNRQTTLELESITEPEDRECHIRKRIARVHQTRTFVHSMQCACFREWVTNFFARNTHASSLPACVIRGRLALAELGSVSVHWFEPKDLPKLHIASTKKRPLKSCHCQIPATTRELQGMMYGGRTSTTEPKILIWLYFVQHGIGNRSHPTFG